MAEESLNYTPALYGGLFIDRNAKFLLPLHYSNAERFLVVVIKKNGPSRLDGPFFFYLVVVIVIF